MLRMGIIGAENSHCWHIANLMNVQKAVGCRVVSVWGETAAFAKEAAAKGAIPKIVKDWREMLGEVDGVMITHRHAKYHAEPATWFVKQGVPCFVDKPFTFTLAEGKKLCRLAKERKVPITSFSVRVYQQGFKDYRKAVKAAGNVLFYNSNGPCELKSKYGGVFFYGIHQVDPVIELFGNQVDTVFLQRNGTRGVATLTYKNGPTATINCLTGGLHQFHSMAVGDKGVVNYMFPVDKSPYLTGAKMFTRMFRTGKEPIEHERFLAPIAVLEAMAKSLKLGKPVKVAKVACETSGTK